jgi:glycosyltransferase involved in cell wall biosynthesis
MLPRKALPLALEALSKLSPDVKYSLTIIGGAGPIANFIPQLLKKYNLEDKAVWTGQIPYSEVLQAYKTHDLFLFSSLRDSSVTQLLESMSNALPYVTLNLNGAKVLLPENTGLKVPVTTSEETVKAFTQAIEFMYRNPEKRIQMGIDGYKYAKEESWVKKAKEITAHYKDLGLIK